MKPLSVVLIGLGLLATSCAGVGPSAPGDGVTRASPSESAQVLPPESAKTLPLSDSSVSPEARPADGAVAHAASELSRSLVDDERFASVEVLEGNEIVVHWQGPVDSKLQDLLNRFPGVQISVATSSCSPGRLREYGSELLTTDPAVNIASVSADGSSLRLTLDESVKATSDVASLERKYSEAVGCPVKVEFGDVMPAGS